MFRQCFLILALLLSLASSSWALDLGLSLHRAMAYSAARSVSGGSLGVFNPIPFAPHLGATLFSFERRSDGAFVEQQRWTLHTKAQVSILHLFYDLPVPFVHVITGVGTGSLRTETQVIRESNLVFEGAIDQAEDAVPVGSFFLWLGYDVWGWFGLNVGYEAIFAPDSDLIKDLDLPVAGIATKRDFSGGLSTFGIHFIF